MFTVEKFNLRIGEGKQKMNENLTEDVLKVRHKFAPTQNHKHRYRYLALLL